MGKYRLGLRSRMRLQGVHPDLVRVVERAIQITAVDFTVLEGVRSPGRQRQLVASGASQTMDSRHITGHAVDLGAWVGDAVRWDWPLYLHIAHAMRTASLALEIPVRWGGTWKLLVGNEDLSMAMLHKKFPDGPHFELSRGKYPGGKTDG